MQKYAEEIRSFIVDNFMFGRTKKTFTDQDSFLQNGIIDSTGVLELVTFIEQRFGIKVDNKDLVPANLDSITNVASFVARKIILKKDADASAGHEAG